MFYLDNQTATRPFSKAVEAYTKQMEDHFASLFSPYDLGQTQIEPINVNLKKLYDLLGAEGVDSFLLTSSGAEAVSQVLYSAYLFGVQGSKKTLFLTTEFEEAPTMLTLSDLKRVGAEHKRVPLNKKGEIDLKALKKELKADISLVSLSWVNSLTGVIHPIKEVVDLCKQQGAPVHLDVTGAMGNENFYFKDLGVNYLTFDGARVHAPKGTGGIFIKENAPFFELIRGGEPMHLPGLVALRVAIEELYTRLDHMTLETMLLRDRLEEKLKKGCSGATVLFENGERTPNVTVVSFPGVESEALLFSLQEKGVYATFGGGRFPSLSQLLSGCQVEEKFALSALSFSLSYETTKDEIDQAATLICETVNKLQKISHEYQKELV